MSQSGSLPFIIRLEPETGSYYHLVSGARAVLHYVRESDDAPLTRVGIKEITTDTVAGRAPCDGTIPAVNDAVDDDFEGGGIMKLEGKKIAILIEDLYNDREVWYPYYLMKEEGALVSCIGPKKITYRGKNEIPVETDLAIDETDTSDFDAVIIPGGFAPDLMRRTPAMAAFVGKMHAEGKLIASICHGGWMLASAGILKGKTVTSFFAIRDDMTNAGADWIDEEVVRDGNIITSRKPDDLPAFCRTIIEALC